MRKMCPAGCGCSYGRHGCFTGVCSWYNAMSAKFYASTSLERSYALASEYADANWSKPKLPEVPEILPAWMDGDVMAYLDRVKACGFTLDTAAPRLQARAAFDHLLKSYGTSSPEDAKKVLERQAREISVRIDVRKILVAAACSSKHSLVSLGDQCRKGAIRGS